MTGERSGLRRSRLRAAAAVVAALALGACAGSSAGGSVATSQGGPAPPVGGLSVPPLAGEWTPPMLVAGDVQALAEALAGRRWSLAVGRRFTAEAEREALRGLVVGLSGGVEEVRAGALAELVGGGGVGLEGREVGERGRPRYAAASLPVDPSWREEHPGATLVIDDAVLDAGAWSSLQAFAVGTCEPPLQALAEAQEGSLALLTPFLDHVDQVLWRSFRGLLDARLPAMLEALRADAEPRLRVDFADDAAHARHLCAHAYWRHVDAFARCGPAASSCPLGPRIILDGRAKIGLLEPEVAVPEGCAALVGHDYVDELRGLGRRAAASAGARLSVEWSVLADRLATVGEIYAALEDICVPRRRRFSAADLDEARRRLEALGEALGSSERGARGRWAVEDGELDVAGVGALRLLARFDAGRGSLNEEIRAGARGLREWVLGRSRCRGVPGELPLALVALGEGARAEVTFFGLFYEEEILCGDLPPLVGRGGEAEVVLRRE